MEETENKIHVKTYLNDPIYYLYILRLLDRKRYEKNVANARIANQEKNVYVENGFPLAVWMNNQFMPESLI